ncbi:hypothetical protein NG797_10825 [Laspinema sp. D5]|nr:hypothetical protein [Laspinema sp. D3d]
MRYQNRNVSRLCLMRRSPNIYKRIEHRKTLSASPATPDPFLDGLYDGSSELSTEAEAILTAEVQSSLT